jgi:hypothetical protein
MFYVVLNQSVRIFRVVDVDNPSVVAVTQDWLRKGDSVKIDSLVKKNFESCLKDFYPASWKAHNGFFILESELRSSLEKRPIRRIR